MISVPRSSFVVSSKEYSGSTVAAPFHGNSAFFVRFRHDLYFLGNHERGVETKTEVTDDRSGVVLVFLDELLGAGESDLVDVLIDLLGRHTDTPVRDRDRFVIELNLYGQIAEFAFKLAYGKKAFLTSG